MFGPFEITELILRGAAIGVNLLLAGLILMSRAPKLRRYLAALFITATSAYILQSADDLIPLTGVFDLVTKALAILNTVFFWWFARSLFEDEFQWTAIKIAPLLALVLMHLDWVVQDAGVVTSVEFILHSVLSILLMAHAVWIAVSNRDDDLVDPRRRFRLAFAISIGLAGIAIAIGENIHETVGLPDWIGLLHATAITLLTFFFAFWMLSANRALFGPVQETPKVVEIVPQRAPEKLIAPADRAALNKLATLMDEGVYREDGLSVAVLAEKVGVPEHQLRRLINREMGFRNFASFLNIRRIEDAKTELADPMLAKKQVLQIALDLGYGSIAPFNRAFKNATGQTPTEYRKEKLGTG